MQYFTFFVIEVAAFLVLRHTQPDIARGFELPCGLAGAWLVAAVLVVSLALCFGVMVADVPDIFAAAVAMNAVLIAYYFASKRWCHRMHQDDLFKAGAVLEDAAKGKAVDEDLAEMMQPLI